MTTKPTTKIARHTADAIYVRGASLVDDLIGKLTFTEMMYFQLLGVKPTAGAGESPRRGAGDADGARHHALGDRHAPDLRFLPRGDPGRGGGRAAGGGKYFYRDDGRMCSQFGGNPFVFFTGNQSEGNCNSFSSVEATHSRLRPSAPQARRSALAAPDRRRRGSGRARAATSARCACWRRKSMRPGAGTSPSTPPARSPRCWAKSACRRKSCAASPW